MPRPPLCALLPEEDALEDLGDDDGTDPTVPGDLWFGVRGSGSRQVTNMCIVYSPLARDPGPAAAIQN